jgi:hypothetical protein
MKMGKNTQRTRVILVLGSMLVIFGLYWTLTSDSTSPSSPPNNREAYSEEEDESINRRIEAKRKQHEEELKKRKEEIEADSKRRKVEVEEEEEEKKKMEAEEEEDLTAYKRILKETIDVRWKLPSSIKRPNFVIFLADDLGWGDVGCYGADFKTPNLDSLASSGVKFQQWYSAAPVCSPSRAALLTGRYPQKTGITQILEGGRDRIAGLPKDEVTLAKALKVLFLSFFLLLALLLLLLLAP